LVDLRNKVTNIAETISSTSNAETAFSSFNNHLSIAIDEYAPYTTKTYRIRPNTQWYTANIRKAKTIRRRLERKWKKSHLQADLHAYKSQCKFVNHLMFTAKSDFISNKVLESSDDIKKLFCVVKDILTWKQEPILPDTNLATLPDDFNQFFIDKIVKIRETFSLSTLEQAQQDLLQDLSSSSCSVLCDFEPT
jgi:hypothetical protein